MIITFDIPSDKMQRVIDAIKGLFPIPQKLSDPKDPDSPMVNEFTDAEWAKECMRKWVINQVARWENMQAYKAVSVSKDDAIIT